MNYELMAKATNVVADVVEKQPGETANKIVEFFEKPQVKATGYIVITAIAIVGVCYCLKALFKKAAKKMANRY